MLKSTIVNHETRHRENIEKIRRGKSSLQTKKTNLQVEREVDLKMKIMT